MLLKDGWIRGVKNKGKKIKLSPPRKIKNLRPIRRRVISNIQMYRSFDRIQMDKTLVIVFNASSRHRSSSGKKKV